MNQPGGQIHTGLWLTPHDQYLLIGMTGEDNVEVIDWRNRAIIKRITTGRGAHNFRPLNDGRHVFVSNGVDSTISELDEITLTKVKDIAGLRPGPDDMELTSNARYLWVRFPFSKSVGVIEAGDGNPGGALAAWTVLLQSAPVGELSGHSWARSFDGTGVLNAGRRHMVAPFHIELLLMLFSL